MHVRLLSMLVFSGGFVVMTIELLGGRLLAPYFGSSIYVWGSLITVFMLALSIGYLLGGQASVRSPSLFRLGLMFLVAAVAVLPVLLLGDTLMGAVFELIDDPRYGSLLSSMGFFFVPTVVLGMISPYAVRLLVEHREHSGQVAGRLYFMSTLGSAIGTLATSFYLVLLFEVWQIIAGIVAVLIACGLSAIVVGARAVRLQGV